MSDLTCVRLTKKGYMRGWLVDEHGHRRQVLEHRYVWERANGPVPDGFDIHHENEIKTDNRLENLRLLDKLTHKRIHSGCKLIDGEWWRPCKDCGEFKKLDQYYMKRNQKDGKMHPVERCKPCHIRIAIAVKRRARARRVKLPA